MKYYIKIGLLLCFPLLLSAQLELNNNGVIIKVRAGTDLRVNNGSIDNQNGGSIDNEGNIYLDANFNQVTGATYAGGFSSWLWFEGAANQNMTSDALLLIPSLRVDNGNRLILGNDVSVSNRIDLMNNGSIELGAFNLVSTNTSGFSLITNYDANNYVITNGTGSLQLYVPNPFTVVFPVGNSAYNPARISQGFGSTSDNFRVRVEDLVRVSYPAGPLETYGVVNRTWHIEEGNTATPLNLGLTLQWNTADELASFDRTVSGISHWNGTTWDRSPTWTNANTVGASWSQFRSGITSLSPFAVEDLQMDLPVELLSFDAVRINPDLVQLDWATASELNNKGFYVERMLEVEQVFETIAFVDGKGTTSNTSYYNLEDDNSYAGMSYYRLKQVDYDGTFSYSPVRAVAGVGRANTFGATIFPNPVEDVLKVRFDELPAGVEEANFRIIGINGQILYDVVSKIQGHQLVKLDFVKNLVPASYVLMVTLDSGERVLEKFVKN